MALEYTWKLTGLKRQSNGIIDSGVVGTNWKLTGTDEDGYQGTFTGATPFELNTISTGSYIPYEELTEEIVLGWVKNIVSGSNRTGNYMGHINEQIYKEIQHSKYPKADIAETDMPWAPTSGSGPSLSANMAAPI
jgi:hypothetical protein